MAMSSVEEEVRRIVGIFPRRKRTPKIPKNLMPRTVAKPPQISSPPPPAPPLPQPPQISSPPACSRSQRKRKNTLIDQKEEPNKKRKVNGVSNKKRRKVQILDGPAEAPPLPQETMEFIAKKRGIYELQLLLQKKLFTSDVDPQQNRFSVPESSLNDLDFMFPKEWAEVAERWKEKDEDGDDNGGNQKKGPIFGRKVRMVDPNLKIRFLDLKRWDLSSSTSFMFTEKWSDIVKENQLKKGDIVQLWFFRDRELEPTFALVKLAP